MQTINSWKTARVRQKQNRSALSSLILAGNNSSYILYRLRFFLINTLLIVGIHIVEFIFLLQFLGLHHTSLLFSLRAFSWVVIGAWWGALEVMRESIRKLYKQKAKNDIVETITAWLYLGGITGTILFIVVFICKLIIAKSNFQYEMFVDFYMVIILIQTLIRLLIRTIHSGRFAIGRVYRPFWSITLPEIFTAAGVFCLWPLIGIKALPIAFFLGSIISAMITWYYCSQSYAQLKYPSFHWISIKKFIAIFKKTSLKQIALTSIAGFTMTIEGILVILLLKSNTSLQYEKLVLAFYLILPLVQSSFNWSRLFYFDFTKISNPIFFHFHDRLLKASHKAAIVISLTSFMAALVIYSFYLMPTALIIIIYFFVFLMSGFLSLQLISCFCQHDFKSCILASGFFVISIPLILFGSFSFKSNLMIIVTVLSLSNILLYFLPIKKNKSLCISNYDGYYFELIDYISKKITSAIIIRASFGAKKPYYYYNKFQLIMRSIAKGVFINYPAKGKVFICSTDLQSQCSQMMTDQLLIDSAGTMSDIQRFVLNANNKSSLKTFLLGSEVDYSQSLEAMINFIHHTVPAGIIINLTDSQGPMLQEISKMDWEIIWQGLLSYLSRPYEIQDRKGWGYFVSAIFDKDVISQVVICQKCNCEKATWREILARCNAYNLTQLLPDSDI